MPFVFTAPAYAERDKHSSLYDKLREVCDLWIMNDVMVLEEFQPKRKAVYNNPIEEANMMTYDEADAHAKQSLLISTGSPLSTKGFIPSIFGGFIPGTIETKVDDFSDNIPDSETKTQIRITLSRVCSFEVDNIIDYMIRYAAKGFDGHVMAKPVTYKEDPTTVWQKINVARV